MFLSSVAFLYCTSDSTAPTSLITQCSHLKRGLSRGRFPAGLFSITVLIINPCFLHACPDHFSHLTDISFVILGRWKGPGISYYVFSSTSRFFAWSKNHSQNFPFKTSNLIFLLRGHISEPYNSIECIKVIFNWIFWYYFKT